MNAKHGSELGPRRHEDATVVVQRRAAPGKQARTDELSGGSASASAVQRRAVQRQDATADDRAGDWSMSDGMMAAMGLGQVDVAATAERGVAAASSPLPHLETIQRSFGKHDVSHIRAQIGGEAQVAAKSLGAHAYATGDRIAFAQAPDLHTAAHEAAHVVQQSGGVKLDGGLGKAGDLYEQHADTVADAVVAGRSAEALLDGFASSASRDKSAEKAGDKSAEKSGASERATQRKAVQLAPAVYKSDTTIKAMTLRQFDAYANEQADWAISPAIVADKELLRSLLAFARKDDRLVLGACGGFLVSAMLARPGQGSSGDTALAAYSRSASSSSELNAATVVIEHPAATVNLAIRWGEAILKLQKTIPGIILHHVLPQKASGPWLRQLVDIGAVDDFIQYYADIKPMLDADNGREISSFLMFHDEGGHAKRATYKAQLPEIRNYHRFTVTQLDALIVNKNNAKNNKAKVAPLPICAIVQTAFDHNGAFHRDDHLTDVITRISHITLIAEGKSSLAAYSAELAKFAAFGKDDRVDEVMVNGHGNAKSMELGGDKISGTRKVDGKHVYIPSKNEPLIVDKDPRIPDKYRTDTDTFIQSIKSVLRDDPGARVVLNACLTASNSVDVPVLDPDPTKAAKQIREAILAHPSLATALQAQLGAHQGKVLGSNSSFGREATLLDGGNHIDIASPVKDPQLTNPDKRVYAEEGTEPTGVLRAALEAWGNDRAATIEALERRIVARGGSTAWNETVITALIKRVVLHPNDASLMSSLIAAAGALGHLTAIAHCKVSELKGKVPDAHLDAIFTDLTTATVFTNAGFKHIPTVLYQVWGNKQDAKLLALRTFLDTAGLTTVTAGAFLDLDYLIPHITKLLPLPGAPATPPTGTFLIALTYLVQKRAAAPAEAKAYIASVAGVSKTFPGTCGVDALLDGASARSVLENAGVVAKEVKAPIGGGGGGGAPEPNLAPTGAGHNTLAIKSETRKCRTEGLGSTNVYMLPSGVKVGSIASGTTLHVIGSVTGRQQRAFGDRDDVAFYAVEHTVDANHTVFIPVHDVADA